MGFAILHHAPAVWLLQSLPNASSRQQRSVPTVSEAGKAEALLQPAITPSQLYCLCRRGFDRSLSSDEASSTCIAEISGHSSSAAARGDAASCAEGYADRWASSCRRSSATICGPKRISYACRCTEEIRQKSERSQEPNRTPDVVSNAATCY